MGVLVSRVTPCGLVNVHVAGDRDAEESWKMGMKILKPGQAVNLVYISNLEAKRLRETKCLSKEEIEYIASAAIGGYQCSCDHVSPIFIEDTTVNRLIKAGMIVNVGGVGPEYEKEVNAERTRKNYLEAKGGPYETVYLPLCGLPGMYNNPWEFGGWHLTLYVKHLLCSILREMVPGDRSCDMSGVVRGDQNKIWSYDGKLFARLKDTSGNVGVEGDIWNSIKGCKVAIRVYGKQNIRIEWNYTREDELFRDFPTKLWAVGTLIKCLAEEAKVANGQELEAVAEGVRLTSATISGRCAVEVGLRAWPRGPVNRMKHLEVEIADIQEAMIAGRLAKATQFTR